MTKTLKLFFIILSCSLGAASASGFIQCKTSDSSRSFAITPMLKRNLLGPGKHIDKENSFALIRMKDSNGTIKEQEFNHYKVSERDNFTKIEAKSKFQGNFIAERIWKEVFRKVPDFRVKLKIKDYDSGKGTISFFEFDSKGNYKRSRYKVSCKFFE